MNKESSISAKNDNAQQLEEIYYQALLTKDSHYEGVFFVGVTSTGIFCRPTCPARKPKFENCEFFADVQAAMLAGYRPCKRCQPIAEPNATSPIVQTLVDAVEANPAKRWQAADLEPFQIDASTARRQFKKRFGMTFVQYARARRMGLAMNAIRKGESVIKAQLEAGYDSGSGFRDAFSQILGAAPSKHNQQVLMASWLDTPLGAMLALADDEALFLLEFVDRRGLEQEIKNMRSKHGYAILPGKTAITQQIDREIKMYFAGTCLSFQTPYKYLGTAFQQTVWQQLTEIPTGKTCSYQDIAKAIDKPTAMRAVARANGANQLAIIVPCHRVIGSDGKLRGYAGGLARKQWLLEHEAKYSKR